MCAVQAGPGAAASHETPRGASSQTATMLFQSTVMSPQHGGGGAQEYADHESMSVENEMRDIMRGEQPEHAHSMDDIVILLSDEGRTQVCPPPPSPSCRLTRHYTLYFII